jgi:hypothetical protein
MSNYNINLKNNHAVVTVWSFDNLKDAGQDELLRNRPYDTATMAIMRNGKSVYRDVINSVESIERNGGFGDKLNTLHAHRNATKRVDADDERAIVMRDTFARNEPVVFIVKFR